jgi:hypothetical protein
MDQQIRRRLPEEASPSETPSGMNIVFLSGSANALRPDMRDRRFAVIDLDSKAATLRVAILESAAGATAAEPTNTEMRMYSFLARLSGKMEALGEPDLDAVLWRLTETKPAHAKVG